MRKDSLASILILLVRRVLVVVFDLELSNPEPDSSELDYVPLLDVKLIALAWLQFVLVVPDDVPGHLYVVLVGLLVD